MQNNPPLCASPRSVLTTALALTAFVSLCSTACFGQATITPGEGVSFSQEDFDFNGVTTVSNTGVVDVNLATLMVATGINSGYLNISDGDGWVVQNLPILASDPYPDIETHFNLGTTFGTTDASLNAFAQFSANPVTSFSNAPNTSFTLGAADQYDAEGFGGDYAGGNEPAPLAGAINFQAGGLVSASFQPNHPNVQAAMNQCLPAAVANSLQYLKTTYGLNVPDPNVPGRGDFSTTPPSQKVPNGAGMEKAGDSLVGQLDVTTGRNSASRTVGPAVGGLAGLQGKLQYLENAGLGAQVVVQHQGQNGGLTSANLPAMVTSMNGTVTSSSQGNRVTSDFILNEIKAGEDVEMGFLYRGANGQDNGGHFVDLVGAGTILGVPWVAYQSDHLQTDMDPNDALGTGTTDFAFLSDIDTDGRLNLVGENTTPNVAVVYSESTIPEPSTLALLGFGLAAVFLFGHKRLLRKT
ncbi:MAG: PEP-CTERM sorting domain-containing protein [Armatimonadetes bacterium]|nr:PEP-CTERM sorting domain-containing protein [Armatimonadota bacterium]